MMRAAALVIGAGLALIAIGARAEAEPSEAERLYQEGQQAYDERRYDVALARWQRSYELSKLPGLLFNIAQAYRLRGAAGDCARAAESYQRFLQLDPGAARRATAESLLQDLEGCAKASPRPPEGSPPEPDESTDEPPAPPPPPTDSGAASPRPGGAAGAGPESGPDVSVTSRRGASKRIAGMIAAGGGAAVALVGVYFGARASRLGDEVSEACAAGCLWSDVAAKNASGRSAERTQWILYGAGAAGLLAGGALYYLGTRERAQAIAVTPRGGGALLTWSGRW